MEDATLWGDDDGDVAGAGTAWERQLAAREIERLKTELVQVGGPSTPNPCLDVDDGTT